MYLKSLTLRGFKSFADKTTMQFDPGLTVVVGPNGSGKSNVSDAILWVFGEQSARSLRGQAMEDVIFSGSSARNPVSVAEVTLVLDNSDHTLALDFSEVAITRRMYRSGESEYLINNSPARLMDIQDILHDSGLGKDTHSIISQGRLDAILSSRPEERRALIEEAAGISKHRRRKERSVRKLRAMDENLQRAKDIAREISRQLRPLERQVDKAKRASEIEERLREISCSLAVDDLRRLQREWQKCEARQKEADAALELARFRYKERSAELDRLQSLLEQKGLFVGDLGERRRRLQDLLGRMDSDMRLLEEKGKNMVSRLSEMRMSISSSERRRQDIKRELSELESSRAASQGTLRELKEQLAHLNPAAEASAAELKKLEEELQEVNARLRSARRKSDEEHLNHARLAEKVNQAEVTDSLFEQRLEELENQHKEMSDAHRASLDLEGRLLEDRDKLQKHFEDLGLKLSGFESKISALESAQESARLELSDARAALSALKSLDLNSAKTNARMRDTSLAAKEQGIDLVPLSDVISLKEGAPQEFEELLEGFLGEAVETLIGFDDEECQKLAFLARDSKAEGQACLIMPSVLNTSSLHTPLKELDAKAKHLLSHFEIDARVEAAITALLASVYVVEDLETALMLHKNLRQAASKMKAEERALLEGLVLLALDSSAVFADGQIKIGYAHISEHGVFERKRRMRELEQQIPSLEARLQEAEAELSTKRSELSSARENRDVAQRELARLEGELSSTQAHTTRLALTIENLDQQKLRLGSERSDAATAAQDAHARLASILELAKTADTQVEELSEKLEALQDKREEIQRSSQRASQELSAARLELATVEERSRHLESRYLELSDRDRRTEHHIRKTREAALALDVVQLRITPLHKLYEELRAVAALWAQRLQDRASLVEADSDSLKKTIGDARGQVAAEQEQIDTAQNELSEAKVEASRVSVRVEAAIASITEQGYVLEEVLELPEPEDRELLEREVTSLRGRLESIGPVNHVAMEEYLNLKQRNDHIVAQVEDLEGARKRLSRITSAIEKKMRQQFLATFEEVNRNFGEMFALLFSGGRAHLELTDPDHLDETGVEVHAQPRGKRLSKMMLMSGGEKSLVALALLFAAYKTRVVPFFVFDEVEAALDDANLDKLLLAMDQIKKGTQLVVISHQRRTMEQADVLYGVSMQSDGVSRVVSQRLDRKSGKVVEL